MLIVAVCATGVNQAPSYEKDLVDDRRRRLAVGE